MKDYLHDSKNHNDLHQKITAELTNVIHQKNNIIAQLLEEHEEAKQIFSGNALDSLEQLLYSFLLAIRTLEGEPISDNTKSYFYSLRDTIDKQLNQLRQTTLCLYPTSIDDLGPVGSIKAHYHSLFARGILTIPIEFEGRLKRYHGKIEIQLFRILQHLIHLFNQVGVQPLYIKFEEDKVRIQLGEQLIESFAKAPKYLLLMNIIDSLDDINCESLLENEIVIQILV